MLPGIRARRGLGTAGPRGQQGLNVTGWKMGLYLCTGIPNRPTRKLCKFQAMTLWHTGDQVVKLGLAMSAGASCFTGSGQGLPQEGEEQSGSPRTSQRSMQLGSNPPPCVMYLREFRISLFYVHLMPKLVAHKPADQGQALGPTALLLLVHLHVLPDLSASECGHIHNKQLHVPH